MSLKDFSIITKLGEGAYSTVYKVQRLADNQIYALKKVKLNNLSEKEIQNSINQVRILASIKSDFIVSYKEVFLDGKTLCIVMEFLDDGDLYQKIAQIKKKKAKFEQNQIWSIFIQIIMGLKTLHANDIYHRDLKSANIFLTKNGQAKLGDLNVSKIAKNGLLYTQTGTPYYASPQVWKDQPYDLKSDIWSVGCIIYQMAMLDPPFRAQDMEGLFNCVTTGKFKPLTSNYSNDLNQVIKLLLALKPKLRPTTEKILSSALIRKKLEQLSLSINLNQCLDQSKSIMLRTIRIPKNLYNLTDRLPKPNYDLEEKGSNPNTTAINTPHKKSIKKRKSSVESLPKLRPSKNHNSIYDSNKQEKQQKNKRKKQNNNSLVVEGMSKLARQAKGYEKKGKQIDRQIKQQINKIKNKKRKDEKQGKHETLPRIR